MGLLSGILLTGCGGGGGSGDSGTGGANASGQVVVGLTDAQGDFITYSVDVVALSLRKQDGATVEVLPIKTRIDFAQYVELTEFVTAATIPAGRYTQASIVLDYQNADIRVEDANGNAVQVGTIQDQNGAPVSTLQVSVHLEDRNALFIAPGIPAYLTLDFDLKASNQVAFDASNLPTLTVLPLLVADVNPQDPKIHRLRGPLKSVDVASGTFEVIIRPFIHVLSGGDERFGTLHVVTDGATIYDINGSLYEGPAGLQVLDQQQTLTAVVVVGDLKPGLRRFEARQVYAGASVPGGTLDVVTGTVMRRTGNLLTVKGATLHRSEGSVVFNNTIQILLDAGTRVSRQHSAASYDIGDISVGQFITAFGLLNSEQTELNATEGFVHMHLTTLKGVVAGVDSTLNVNLTAINGRDIGLFDFSGTGVDPVNDANPAQYQVDTGALDISGLTNGTPAKCRGYVTEYAHPANVADFEAVTLVDVSKVKGVMVINWVPPAADALGGITAEGLTINLAGAGDFHRLNRAGVLTDLTQLSGQPKVKPQSSGSGLFVIHQGNSSQLFFAFEGFADELTQRLNENARVQSTVARGLFEDATITLTADWVVVNLNDE
jgi:hypothetical protein